MGKKMIKQWESLCNMQKMPRSTFVAPTRMYMSSLVGGRCGIFFEKTKTNLKNKKLQCESVFKHYYKMIIFSIRQEFDEVI